MKNITLKYKTMFVFVSEIPGVPDAPMFSCEKTTVSDVFNKLFVDAGFRDDVKKGTIQFEGLSEEEELLLFPFLL